jgi:hypothetical protein
MSYTGSQRVLDKEFDWQKMAVKGFFNKKYGKRKVGRKVRGGDTSNLYHKKIDRL